MRPLMVILLGALTLALGVIVTVMVLSWSSQPAQGYDWLTLAEKAGLQTLMDSLPSTASPVQTPPSRVLRQAVLLKPKILMCFEMVSCPTILFFRGHLTLYNLKASSLAFLARKNVTVPE